MSKSKQSTKAAVKSTSTKAAETKGSKNRLPKEKKPAMTSSKRAKMLEGKQSELLKADQQRSRAATDWAYAHARAAELKKFLDKSQARVNQIIGDIRNIRSGNYTPSLPFDEAAGGGEGYAEGNGEAESNGQQPAPTVDQGAMQPLSALLEFTGKDGKKLLTSGKVDLVKDVVGATVGHLEAYQREHAFDWRERVKGLGSEGGDKLLDAMAAFRKKFPMPDVVLTESEKAAKGATPATDPAGKTETTSKNIEVPAAAVPSQDPELVKAYQAGCEAGLSYPKLKIECPKKMSEAEKAEWQRGYDETKAQ